MTNYNKKLDEIFPDESKDNSLGHSSDNTVWACSLCNMTRGNRFSVEQMEQIGQVIRSFYE